MRRKKQDFFSYNLSVKPKINSQTGQKTANEILKKKEKEFVLNTLTSTRY